ncbi:hypothetical protein [Amycolatopsis viridis]|uniref:PE domain-containing protein n=1 Tax=Amycolatopsis viridis TaxID=185678 RepID=A0ABX0T4G7_9PSEU|nr:hypothetical protein [Amycolatopsis viridis]NIH82460.1 hypothetical protein [Amycolatopsis viridis]
MSEVRVHPLPIADAISNVVGGPEQVKSFADDANRMLEEAQAGHWAVDEETGTHLRSAITTMQNRLDQLAPRVGFLRQTPRLGHDAYAREVAEHMRRAMDSDNQSLVPVFEALRAGLEKLRQALDIAMEKYDAADEAATKHLGQLKD